MVKNGVWINNELLQDEKLTSTDKLVYGVIRSFAKRNGSCYASNNTIAKLLNMSKAQIKKSISKLRKLNYVKSRLVYKIDSKEVNRRYLTLLDYDYRTQSYVKQMSDEELKRKQEEDWDLDPGFLDERT